MSLMEEWRHAAGVAGEVDVTTHGRSDDMDDSEAKRTPGSQLGSLYPMDSIIAHINDGDHAAEAALREAGWEGDDVVTASGDEVTRVSGAAQGGRTFLQRIAATFPSEESRSRTSSRRPRLAELGRSWSRRSRLTGVPPRPPSSKHMAPTACATTASG